jgi:hypothetical protein
MDPEQASRDLAEADLRLRRGARLALPPRWWQPVLCLFFVATSAVWDVPASWRGVMMLSLGSAMLAVALLASATARARRLPIPMGWRTAMLIAVIAVTAYAVMMGLGLALRILTLPAPFTLSSVLVIVTLGVAWWAGRRRWQGGYVQRVHRNQW